ncbi:MAG TPA: serine hydrolase [Rhizomicrobium sp.]|nr:serine hydrolase [Rhizomicrobium sp.]
MVSGQARAVVRATLILLAGGFLLAACSGPTTQVTVAAPPPAPPPILWPTHGWQTSTPESQGIDSAVLADAMDTIRARHIPVHSLLIERHGTIVLDAYFYPFADNQLHDVYSITKSVVSSLVGVAVSKQELRDLNTPVLALLPKPATTETIDERKAHLTLAHLLSMTSGLDCRSEGGENFLQQMEHSAHWTAFALDRREVADPGSAFEYCAGNMHLVSAVLSRTTGTSAAAFAQSELFSPLGIQSAVWPSDGDGISQGFAGLKLQPRDMAKLGYLWLHHGVWEGRQILPDSYLQAALTAHANVEPNVQYGYGMWLYPSRGHAGGPADFEANGYGGQRIAVVPSQDMVVVITGAGLDANDVAALISGAVRSNTPLPPNPVASARLGGLVLAAANPASGTRLADTLTKTPPAPQPRPAAPDTRS